MRAQTSAATRMSRAGTSNSGKTCSADQSRLGAAAGPATAIGISCGRAVFVVNTNLAPSGPMLQPDEYVAVTESCRAARMRRSSQYRTGPCSSCRPAAISKPR